MDGSGEFEVVTTIGTVLIGVAIFVVILSSVFSVGFTASTGQNSDVFGVDSGTASLEGVNITDPTVEQSLGHSAELDGSPDSYISGPGAVGVDETWTASTWVRLDDTNRTQMVVSVDSEQLILYNDTSDTWVGVYYNDTTGETRVVENAAGSPTTWTHLSLAYDGTTLTLVENNSDTASATETTSQTFAAQNLDGELDETRVSDDVLTSSERQRQIDRPTAPQPGVNRTYRVMYDSYSSAPGSYPAFFVGTTLGASNVQRGAGFDGEPTELGTDYSRSGRTITTLTGGSLEGAPAIYSSYSRAEGPFVGLLYAIQTTGSTALTIVVLGVLALAGSRLLGLFDDGF